MVKDSHKEYIGNFDILRIIAATIIVFHHYQQITSLKFDVGINFYGGSFYLGYLVELFFVISGFLTEHTFHETNDFKSWIIGKLKRYYPYAVIAGLFTLIVVLVYYLLTGLPLLNCPYDIQTVITSLTLTHSGYILEFTPGVNNPTWYLCILTICFIIYFAIKKLSKISFFDKFGFSLLAILISLPMYYLVTHGVSFIPFFSLSNVRGYGSFFIGCIICRLWKAYSLKILVIIDIILFSLSFAGFAVFGFSKWYILTYLFFPAIVFAALLVPQIDLKLIKTAGAISFEVYIWHVPLYCLFDTIFAALKISIIHSFITMILFCFFVWVIATGLYYFVECPLSKKLNRSIQKHKKVDQAET